MSTTMDTSSVRIIYGRKIWYGTCSWTARERYRLHPLRSNRIPGKEPSEIFSSSTASSPRRGGLHCEYLLPSMSFFSLSLSLFSFASFFFLCCILWQLSFSLNRRVVQQQQQKRRKKNKYSYLIINSIDVVCHQIRTRCNERGRNWFCFSLPLWIFSSRFLRNKDRDDNKDNYPALHWPEVYLLHGGYKAFFQQHESSCTPLGYLPMNQQGHEEDLRRCRAKTKSCNGDGKSGRPLTKSTSRRLELLWCSDCTLKENLIS